MANDVRCDSTCPLLEPSTDVKVCTVSLSAPSESPKDLKKGAVTRTSIDISWKAPSADSFNGHLMGYKVSVSNRNFLN